jgi:RNA polymerase sigma-70 factor, ECF subfamily
MDVYQNEVETKDEDIIPLVFSDSEKFGILINRYESKLRRYINRLGVRSYEDQQDVLQEIFIKTYRNLHGFDTSLSFSSWLYRIAHNESISWYRKQKVRPEGHLVLEGEEVLSFISSPELASEEIFDQKITATAVREALLKLDDKYREVIILRYFEHKEYDEISDILEIPLGSVGTLIHRGKKHLKNVLNQDKKRIG